MLKTLALLKRRPDLDRDEFVRRYETGHRLLGERLLRGRAVRYVRRYLLPAPGSAGEPGHDVAMEIWFADEAAYRAFLTVAADPAIAAEIAADEAAYRAFLTVAADPAIAAEIAADEETLFDRSANRVFLVEEHESDLGPA